MNTAAFNQAVAAVSAAGGGTLVVPVGAFVTGPFNLTSRMTLFLAAGAEIRAPSAAQLGGGPAFPRWPVVAPLPSYGQGRDHPGPRRTAFIGGVGLDDVVLTSASDAWGTIDGGGEPWWKCHYGCNGGRETVTRGHLIQLMHSTNLEISNLKLRNSPFWTVHPFNCTHVARPARTPFRASICAARTLNATA